MCSINSGMAEEKLSVPKVLEGFSISISLRTRPLAKTVNKFADTIIWIGIDFSDESESAVCGILLFCLLVRTIFGVHPKALLVFRSNLPCQRKLHWYYCTSINGAWKMNIFFAANVILGMYVLFSFKTIKRLQIILNASNNISWVAHQFLCHCSLAQEKNYDNVNDTKTLNLVIIKIEARYSIC